MVDDVDTFLVHYGVKGMKWGVRRKSRESKSSSSEGDSAPKRKIDKKKVAIAAGVIGVTAAVTVGAVMLNQKQRSVGQASVMDQMKKMGGESTWDVLTKVNTTPTSKTPTKLTNKELDARVAALKKKVGEDAVKQQIRDFSKQSMWDIMNDTPKQTPKAAPAPEAAARRSGIKTPAQKRREGEEAVKQQIQAFSSRSMWDLAADTSLSAPKKSSYSDRAKKNDTKLYGKKNADRIAKKVNQGVPLSEARQGAAVRAYGPTAARVATNVGAAKLRERRR